MKTIKENIDNEIVIKNSRFICYMIKITSDDINSIINEIKEKHPKATHYCYAFIYDDIKRSSDDNEPSGTAGQPILNVLEKEELNHVLAVVVRYFGGIKLGAGGLIRAYTKSVTETLKISEFVELIKGYKIRLRFNYTEGKNINYILKDSRITNKEYHDDIHYECYIDERLLKYLDKYTPQILEEGYIEKTQL